MATLRQGENVRGRKNHQINILIFIICVAVNYIKKASTIREAMREEEGDRALFAWLYSGALARENLRNFGSRTLFSCLSNEKSILCSTMLVPTFRNVPCNYYNTVYKHRGTPKYRRNGTNH